MASKEIQDLLRFLSQDAKLPLATAMGKVKELQAAELMSPESIAKSKLDQIKAIFPEDKLAKQVHNAAKRSSKKRSAPEDSTQSSPSKRGRKSGSQTTNGLSDAEIEKSLALPYSEESEEELAAVSVYTNRAPLVLAFAVTLLKYTMPHQPLSSRLSLAHTYVSVSSRSRAVDLGIQRGASAAEDGWGDGQPVVRIMGKDIRVMRRSGYIPDERVPATDVKREHEGEDYVKGEEEKGEERETPLWGLDLEALRSNSLVDAFAGNKSGSMPIHTPQAARSYLLKAATPMQQEARDGKKKASAASRAEKTEDNLGRLLKAIDLVYQSWVTDLGPNGLDMRTWGWYASVRPDIAHGKEGWGAKNEVRLGSILALRKKKDRDLEELAQSAR